MIIAITEDSKNQHNYQPLPQTNSNSMENTNDHESDKEDTLSLSDLPIQRNINDDSAADDKTQNMFEFFSPDNQVEKVTTPTFSSTNSPENTKFLGKQVSLNSQNHMMMSGKSRSGNRNTKKSEYWMFQKSKSTSFSPSKLKKNTKDEQKSTSGFTSPLKSKWFLVLLGLPPKIPTDEGELKTDIKNRQSRHAPSTFFPAANSCEEVAEGMAALAAVEDHRRLSDQNKNRRSCTSCFGGGGQQIHT